MTASAEIAKLFAEWSAVDYGDGRDEAQVSKGIRKAARIEKRMLRLTPVTAADLARQLIVHTGNGDFPFERDFLRTTIQPLADMEACQQTSGTDSDRLG